MAAALTPSDGTPGAGAASPPEGCAPSARQGTSAQRERRIAEIETLLGDVAQVGAPFRHIRFILVEWTPGEYFGDARLIIGPTGYRHPQNDPDDDETRKVFGVRGLLSWRKGLPRPRGRRAYALLADHDDAFVATGAEVLEERVVRTGLHPLRALFRRASRLVGHLDGPGALGHGHDDEFPWLAALLEMTEPDQRFTWGLWARQHWGGGRIARGSEPLLSISGDAPDGVPLCLVIEDVVRASQTALRVLLQQATATPSAPPERAQDAPAPAPMRPSPAPTPPPHELGLGPGGRRLTLGGKELAHTRREQEGGPLTKRYVNLRGAEGSLLLTLATKPGSTWRGRPEPPTALRKALRLSGAGIELRGAGATMELVPRPTLSAALQQAWKGLNRRTR